MGYSIDNSMVEVFDFDYTPYTPEEKVVDGVLCVKYSEDAEFTPLSAEDLTELYLYARENLEQLTRCGSRNDGKD